MSDEIRLFVEREARLLDQMRYEEWVGLFLPDARYWVPVSPDQPSPAAGPSHFHDDIQVLMVRTHRLANPRAFAAEPSPRTVHIVSGVCAEEGDEGIAVTSSQIMLEYRNRGNYEDDQRLFGGQVTHTLHRVDGTLRIAHKRIDLINAQGAFNAMLAPL
ncbi:MAG: aromatic-ring-hydroxylating dioxygenase subunit beta [Erythrobacter sp.]|jgi:benzoate/toluate 1,2-dioxygenase beta subunit|nr:aromatic-ring-hydroxylating dioxygenase subunit beta [Erythrobacter sp.]